MALERKDRVKDQTSTTGTGTITIDGVAPTGYRTFTSAHTTGSTVRYTIVNSTQTEWEVGEGIWTSATNTLTRATVFASSNAGSLVSFSSGVKTVFTGPTAADLSSFLDLTGGTLTGQLKLDSIGAVTSIQINSGTSSGYVTHLMSNTTSTYSGDNGATTGALFGNLSQPFISNSGAGGSAGVTAYGAYFAPQIVSSGASALIGAYGVQSFAERSNAADVSTNASNALYGGYFTARHTTAIANTTSSNSLTSVGGSALVQGGIATAVASFSAIGNVGTSTAANNTVSVTNYYQFLANPVGVGSAANSYGTITNFYGLYLSAPTVAARGTITNRFGVYQADSAASNFFAGPIQAAASGIRLTGSSTGYTTFASANASATNYTITIPAANDTLVALAATQTLSAKTLGSGTTLGADVTGGDFVQTRTMLKDSGWKYYDSTTTAALDYTNGSHQRWAPTAASAPTLSISNWPPAGNLGELLIEAVNLGAAGTITWPTINWVKSDGTTTTTFSSNGVTLQSSGTDWVYLWTRDAGTTIYGKVVR